MNFRRLIAGLVLAASAVVVPGSPVSANGAQSCLSGEACVAHVSSGSTIYGFISASISNFSSFYWNNPAAPGLSGSVNNTVGFGRNRDSGWTRVCFRSGFNSAGSTLINAPYSGATWVPDGSGTWSSSSYFSTNGSC